MLFAQKDTYKFDYILEYSHEFYIDSITETKTEYYLTNSLDNSYYGFVKELKGDEFEIEFLDRNSKYAKVNVKKSDFNAATFINIDCFNALPYKNPYKYQTKHYDFVDQKDTLIDGKTLKSYKIKPNKPKRAKRNKAGRLVYIIKEETEFHSPIFRYSTAYEESLLINLPKGIFKEKIFYDYRGKIHNKEILQSYKKVDMSIVFSRRLHSEEFDDKN